jgi:circadian clock protein KaiC
MTDDRLSTGVEGLDQVLHGGLIPERGYMLRGEPGAGKTILALHFLTSGASEDETSLFINLEEDESDIRRNAAAVGFDLDGVAFLDLSPTSEEFVEDQSYGVFEASEVEQRPVTEKIIENVREIGPDRVVVDPVTQLRYLTSDEYQFRKQVTGFVQFLEEEDATVLFTSQVTETVPDDDLQFISHGVLDLRNRETGRMIRVPKFRGSDSKGGWHSMRITDSGMEIYPKLTPDAHKREFVPETVSSGIPEMDELLHGGIERGTVTIISGPTGVGKTSLGIQFMKEAAGRGERSVIYEFEESETTLLNRSAAINIPVKEMRERGTLAVTPIEPLSKSPNEFAQMVRAEVEERNAELLMIDGTRGYQMSLRSDEERNLDRELHSVCRYLKNMGISVLLVEETENITGDFKATSRNISYIADNVIFMRYLELDGELRKTIGVLKKRMSNFERTFREFRITEHGIKVGEPLAGLRGILQGIPDSTNRTSQDADRGE